MLHEIASGIYNKNTCNVLGQALLHAGFPQFHNATACVSILPFAIMEYGAYPICWLCPDINSNVLNVTQIQSNEPKKYAQLYAKPKGKHIECT